MKKKMMMMMMIYQVRSVKDDDLAEVMRCEKVQTVHTFSLHLDRTWIAPGRDLKRIREGH